MERRRTFSLVNSGIRSGLRGVAAIESETDPVEGM
jgi:hypothetical protein